MKTKDHYSRQRLKAFTVMETMIAMTIFTFVAGGILTAHMTGLKMYQMAQAKMGASQDARTALNMLAFEVQTGEKVVIGNGDSNSFTAVTATNALHVGNAIQVYVTSNQFIRYFLITNTTAGTNYAKLMRRFTNGTFKVVAENITNRPSASHPTNPSPFAIEYFNGGAIRDEIPDKQQVLSLDFIFYQLQYPIVKLGTNYLFDYYEYRSKITTRIH